MDLTAVTASTSASTSTWRRSVRSRAPVSEREVELLGRRMEELEAMVERLREEKEAAEAEEVALRAELEAERGAAEMAASEAMLMIERLQREKAAALMEARQFRRLAEGRADIDRELQAGVASLSALAASYLSLLHAHGIDPDDEHVERPDEDIDAEADGESGGGGSDLDVKETVVEEKVSPSPHIAGKELEYIIDERCAAATKAVASSVEEHVVGIEGDLYLYARVEALEADSAVTLREVARRLCREAAAAADRGAVVTAEKRRFSVLAICKWLFSIISSRKKCSTAGYVEDAIMAKITLCLSTPLGLCTGCFSSLRVKLGLIPSRLLALLLLADRSTAAAPHRRRRLHRQ